VRRRRAAARGAWSAPVRAHAVAAVVHVDLIALDRSERPGVGGRWWLAEHEGAAVAVYCTERRLAVPIVLGRGVQWGRLRRDAGRLSAGRTQGQRG
jgi:hypothetical protein